MIRVEVIANNSVEENILEALKTQGVGKYYTKYPGICGVGNSGPRMGDPIWPEENFVLVIWCEDEEAMGIERAIASVKEQFPNEGIRIFGMAGTAELKPAPKPQPQPQPKPRPQPAETKAVPKTHSIRSHPVALAAAKAAATKAAADAANAAATKAAAAKKDN